MALSRYPNLKTGPMYIEVQLPTPSQGSRYASGDVVRGTIRVSPKTRPQRIVVHFKGRTKFAITRRNGNGTTTYSHKIPFFSYSLVLFSSSTAGQSYDILGLGVTPDDRVELPFEFAFPHIIELEPPKTFRERVGFEHKAGHALPPTYFYSGSSNVQIVEYYIEAEMWTEHKFVVAKTVRQPVPFNPAGPTIPDDIVELIQDRRFTVRCQTHRLDPNYDPNEGRLARIKQHWKKNDPATPKAIFTILAQVPHVASIDSLLPSISLSLIHTERSDIMPEAPPVYIRQISVQLISTLNVRVPHNSLFFGSDDILDRHQKKLYLLHRRLPAPGWLMYDGMRFDDLGRRISCESPPDAPDFASYGLNLKHVIEVTLEIECAGENFDVLGCRGPVIILPEAKEVVDHAVGTLAMNPVEDILDTDAEAMPPPYESPPYQEIPLSA